MLRLSQAVRGASGREGLGAEDGNILYLMGRSWGCEAPARLGRRGTRTSLTVPDHSPLGGITRGSLL